MPSAVKPAAPVGVMPQALCSAFSEELRMETLVNTYPDGRSERRPLAANPRRTFRLTRALGSSEWLSLFSFFQNHIGKPFYFYAPRETVPPWSWDASGTAPIGRYVVVFDGGWSETTGIPRAAISFSLREVE